ncbi:MAG: carbohydrate porin [Bacteroidia bacterium]
MKMLLYTLPIYSLCLFANETKAQNSIKSDSNSIVTSAKANENWSFHFQATTIAQGHTAFKSPYQGLNSFDPNDKAIHYSITSTLYIGRRLWKNAEFYFNPEIAGGSGMSNVLGIAGAPNGETVRIGDPTPTLYIARLFFRQYIPLGNSDNKTQDADANQLAGTIPTNAICITVGKFSLTDFYDDNDYSHDPRTQFMNWSLMSNGAWDYPANTRGYTSGVVIEYLRPTFEVRFSSCLMPEVANGAQMDWNVTHANGETLEFGKSFQLKKKEGKISLLLYNNFAHMGNYGITTNDTVYHINIAKTRAYGRTKPGFGINIQQNILSDAGIFFRTGWNNGQNETFVFTEIDQTISGGFSFKMKKIKRKNDVFALAFVVNSISQAHRDYLAAGGYGFIIGDGKLNYGNEMIFETYYSAQIFSCFFISPDYQYVINPAYNKDRGPINIFGLRAHVEF